MSKQKKKQNGAILAITLLLVGLFSLMAVAAAQQALLQQKITSSFEASLKMSLIAENALQKHLANLDTAWAKIQQNIEISGIYEEDDLTEATKTLIKISLSKLYAQCPPIENQTFSANSNCYPLNIQSMTESTTGGFRSIRTKEIFYTPPSLKTI